jgi:stage IV sporulation protein B
LDEKKIKLLGLCLVIVVLFAVTSTPFKIFTSIPDEIRLFEGSKLSFPFSLPANGEFTSQNPQVVDVKHNRVRAVSTGQADLQLKLGHLPLKQVKVSVFPELKVYPGGQSIGVHLKSVGPLIVGHHFVETELGKVSPAEQADLRIGDMIIKINDKEITQLEQISRYVNEAGKNGQTLQIEVLRGRDTIQANVKPVFDHKEDIYRLGAYIRNSAAGVGTLTFIEPKTNAYGALGHVITDVDTQRPIIVGRGAILESQVSAIEKGVRGGPGEKLSHIDQHKVLGDVKKNTPFGIFGNLKHPLKNGIIDKPIPVALSEEVQKGPAHIFTVVDGQKVEKFDIEIIETMPQHFPATKGLIIKVTDPVLLKKTGGIIQGMSGSPIIQNGKLVGAVTHVFVNDPTSGYGCFIEWMLHDAGLLNHDKEKPEAA